MENIFRKEYRELSAEQVQLVGNIKDKAQELYNFLAAITPSRESALAKTKLEECVMWATKAAT